MRLSVIMPAYNSGKTIANAIMSIKNQTIKDIELIVVDDGSTDDTVKIAREFEDLYVVGQEHKGLVAARNMGNSFAKGDVIAIQDADDLSMPDRLEKCLKKLEEGYDVVYHGAYINMWDNQYQCISRKYLPAESFDKARLLAGQYIPGWLVFKKKVWEEKPLRMATQYCYDWMMCLDWAYSGYKFGWINEGLYEYVRHENSASIQFEKDGRRQHSIEAIKNIMKNEYEVAKS